MEFTLHQIAGMLKGSVSGDGNQKVRMLAKIQEAGPGEIAFLANPKYEQFIYSTKATAVIVNRDFEPKKDISAALIRVDDAYASFTILLEEYHKLMNFQKTGVEQPSFIGEKSTVGANIYRGAFSYIGSQVTIGDNCKIHPHVFIGDRVVIGNNTILHPNVKLYAGTRIGSNCIIHAGTVIGSDGFGFAPLEDGSYKTIPQLGNVIVEDNVSIGANAVIDCATLMGDSTIISKGVKMDNLIQIAHNVVIGKNTVIAAQSGVAGSSKVGENCMIAGQVGIAGHLEIANRTSLGAQTGVSKSITEEGQRHFGTPSFDIKEYFRSYAIFKKLPDFNYRLRELEKRVPHPIENGAQSQKD
ncbi:MAG: UDP-3-O-(3-hydroxymyristoyl)glucosamine N-acyltransferase [Cyclobacteriaceae bacterium]|jgi:UDP-3-O-[3-hydroxymyristoyl] glucosamine N-acyltransferase|nr:UDP-3-O-(3-hydroxymyristoyl)glucosamine N-acyltransferase [Cytophagales bacterium]HNP77466.1 UDP-3-O-(3-hydroxymyristoyl)glucosamine N-acyltransferase [Cyclobacteriaceae bacterium]